MCHESGQEHAGLCSRSEVSQALSLQSKILENALYPDPRSPVF